MGGGIFIEPAKTKKTNYMDFRENIYEFEGLSH